MHRNNKLAVISHCILNQNSVVHDLARAGGGFYSVAAQLLRFGFGLYQLPCPELLYSGMDRPPRTYHQYAQPAFARLCDEVAASVLRDLDAFLADGTAVRLLVGIRRSPTCSVTDPAGHLMERLVPGLQARCPDLRVLDVPEDYMEGQPHRFDQELAAVLNQ